MSTILNKTGKIIKQKTEIISHNPFVKSGMDFFGDIALLTLFALRFFKEVFPDFIGPSKIQMLSKAGAIKPPFWTTLFMSGGRKDKISKGDIAGLFFKQGNLSKDQLGVIELKQDCAFVAVPSSIADTLVDQLNNVRLKKKKVRVFVV